MTANLQAGYDTFPLRCNGFHSVIRNLPSPVEIFDGSLTS